MLRFFRRKEESTEAQPLSLFGLGSLEEDVMNAMWLLGEANVRDVAAKIERPLAYTTVMTTLDRLYKKRLLVRRKVARAFIYAPRLTREEWERERADQLVAEFLTNGGENSRELLISSLLDAVARHDEAMLESLEKQIRLQRRKLPRKVSRA